MERNEIYKLLKKYSKKEVLQMIIDSRISFEDAVDIAVVQADDEFRNLKPDSKQLQPLIEKGKKEHSFSLSLRYCPWKGDYNGTGITPKDYYVVTILGKEYKVDALPLRD